MDLCDGVLQRSILGQLLFNLFLSDLLLFAEEVDIMSLIDDNTSYVCSENVEVSESRKKLEEVAKIPLEWFSNNFLKGNVGKCNFILCTDEPFAININN